MIELTPETPCAGLLPLEIGECVMQEASPDHITALMPKKSQRRQAAKALKAAHGCGWPGAGRMTGTVKARAVWMGFDQVFLVGPAPAPALAASCAVVDQSDGWAVIEVAGNTSRDVLARLCPVDLRPALFKRGHTARSLLGHMTASISRTGPDRFQIMVFRSMAATAVHELSQAAQNIAARGKILQEF